MNLLSYFHIIVFSNDLSKWSFFMQPGGKFAMFSCNQAQDWVWWNGINSCYTIIKVKGICKMISSNTDILIFSPFPLTDFYLGKIKQTTPMKLSVKNGFQKMTDDQASQVPIQLARQNFEAHYITKISGLDSLANSLWLVTLGHLTKPSHQTFKAFDYRNTNGIHNTQKNLQIIFTKDYNKDYIVPLGTSPDCFNILMLNAERLLMPVWYLTLSQSIKIKCIVNTLE